jgi:hypothetical protein
VIATMQMRVRERDCPVTAGRRDHIVEATLTGAAVARFARARQRHDRSAPAHHGPRPAGRQNPDLGAAATTKAPSVTSQNGMFCAAGQRPPGGVS